MSPFFGPPFLGSMGREAGTRIANSGMQKKVQLSNGGEWESADTVCLRSCQDAINKPAGQVMNNLRQHLLTLLNLAKE